MKPVDQNIPEKIKTVRSLAEYWDEYMPKKPGKRKDTGEQREWDGLLKLLRNFSAFTVDYSAILARAPVTNQRFVANGATERLLKHFDILSRAAEQRRGSITKTSTGYFLAQAEDKLTTYCERWLPHRESHPKYVTLETPVVYFEKSYAISRSLYSPEIPLISIPLNDYDDPDRWFALAHEMGHHIYWNSIGDLEEMTALQVAMYRAVAQEVKLAKGETSEPWGYWLEEIFADICGVLFAGPAYVISTQNVAAEKINQLEDFARNDNEHPVPYLRPWISYEVLHQIQNETARDKEFLEMARQRWILFSKGADQVNCKCGKVRETTLELLQQEVAIVVNTLLNLRTWPEGKCLLDLIQYEKQGTDELNLEPLPPIASFEIWPYREPREEDIPPSLREVWHFLQKRIPENKMTSPVERSKSLWNALIYLSIQDEHGHGSHGAHQDPQFHLWAILAGTHTHIAL